MVLGSGSWTVGGWRLTGRVGFTIPIGTKIVKDLPLNKLVELTLTFLKPGRVPYTCAMDMIRGSITAQ